MQFLCEGIQELYRQESENRGACGNQNEKVAVFKAGKELKERVNR